MYKPLGPGYGSYQFPDGSTSLMSEDDARTLHQLAGQPPSPDAGDPLLGLQPPDRSPPPATSPDGLVDPFAPPPGMVLDRVKMSRSSSTSTSSAGPADQFQPTDQPPSPVMDTLAGAAGALSGAADRAMGAGGAMAGNAMDAAAPAPPELPPGSSNTAPLPTAAPNEIRDATRDDVYAGGVQALNMQAAADTRDAGTRAAGLDERAAIERKTIEDAAKVAADAAKARAEQEARIKATADQYDAAVKDYIATKIDRPKVGLMGALGIILAGAGAVINKDTGMNPAMSIIDKKIQTIVDDKFKAKGAMMEGINLLHGQLDDQSKQLDSIEKNRGLMTAALWEDTGHRLAEIGDRVSSQMERDALHHASADAFAKANSLKADLVEKKMVDVFKQKQLDQEDLNNRRTNATSRANQRDEIAYKRDKDALDRDAAIKAAGAKAAAKAAGNRVADVVVGRNPDGSEIHYTAANARAWNDVTTVMPAAKEVVTIVDRMRELRKGHESMAFVNFLGTPAGAEWRSLTGQLGADFKQMKQLGAWDNGVENLVSKVGGNLDSPTFGDALMQELWRSGPEPGLKSLRDGTVRGTNRLLSAKRLDGTPYENWNPEDTTAGAAPLTRRAHDLLDVVTKAKSPDEIRAAGQPNLLTRGLEAGGSAVAGAVDAVVPEALPDGFVNTSAQRANARAVDALDVQGVQSGGFNVSTDQGAAIRDLGKLTASTSKEDAAAAVKSLVGLAGDMRRPDVAAYALDVLARSGAGPAALEAVKVARTAGLGRAADVQGEVRGVDQAVARTQPVSPLDEVDSLARYARRGDPIARADLNRMAMKGGVAGLAAARVIDDLNRISGAR